MTMNDCPESCPLVSRVEALERDSACNRQDHKEFYAKLESSHTSVALIEERVRQIKADTEEIKTSVQELKAKPGRRWEGLVEKLIWTAAAAVAAFLLGRLGL